MGKVLSIEKINSSNTSYRNGRKKLEYRFDASLEDIHNHPMTPELFKSTLGKWLSWQERVETSMAASITAISLAPQWIASLYTWGVWINLQDGSEVSIEDFLQKRAKKSEVCSLTLPGDVPGRVWADHAVCRTPRDYPIIFTALVMDMDKGKVVSARMAMTGASRKSVQGIKSVNEIAGKDLDEEMITQVENGIRSEVEPVDDFRGSADYRREMAALSARRSLLTCLKGVK